MKILGISAFYHDSAACLVQDGKITAAAQEERFTRKKHDFSFPKNAVNFCLQKARINAKDLDCVAFYDKPFVKFERILETYLSYAPRGYQSFIKAIPLWIKQKIWMKDIIHEYKAKAPEEVARLEQVLFQVQNSDNWKWALNKEDPKVKKAREKRQKEFGDRYQ